MARLSKQLRSLTARAFRPCSMLPVSRGAVNEDRMRGSGSAQARRMTRNVIFRPSAFHPCPQGNTEHVGKRQPREHLSNAWPASFSENELGRPQRVSMP